MQIMLQFFQMTKKVYTNQHAHLFEEIKPNKLIKVNLFELRKNILKKVNIAGYYIHRNYLSKYEPKAILHTHSENVVVILFKRCLTKLNQSSMRFYNAVEYVDYNAMAINQDEGKKLPIN